MELNEQTAATAGGVLGGLAAAWGVMAGAFRRMRARAEWKGRVESSLERNTVELGALRDEVRTGFHELNGRIDALLQR